MDTSRKLEILSESSQYDLACACGSTSHDRRSRGADGRWLYPVPLPSGGYSILLKTLLSNHCVNDCEYCPLRAERDARRVSLGPEEMADLFMDYLRTHKIHGLFLSSGVTRDPDHAMDRINAVASIIRKKRQFKGFMHLKIIPGASDAAIEETLSLASAASVNIECPGERHFSRLSKRKRYLDDIIRPIKLLSRLTGRGMKYSRVRTSTQFIVGASDEKDQEIVNYMSGLYDRLNYNRVYFSAYQRGLGSPELPGEKRFELLPGDCLTREHRLYQVDFLLRQYQFNGSDIYYDRDGNLDLSKDPKEIWADHHPELFPIKINSASEAELLKAPGLGPVTVKRILKARQQRRVTDLRKLGVNGKRLEKTSRYVIFE